MATTLSPANRLTRLRLPLWQAATATIVIATITGAIVYGIARAAGTLPHSVLVSTPGGEEPITLVPVILASAQGALAAKIAYALLRRFTGRPGRNFSAIGAVFLALSLAPIFTIDGAPARMVVTLIAMHIAVGLAILVTLTGLTAPKGRA